MIAVYARRFSGATLAALALFSLGLDFHHALTQGGLHLSSLGEFWYGLSRKSLTAFQVGVERHLTPFLWDPVISAVIRLPAVLVLGFGAAMLLSGPCIAHRLCGARRRKAADVIPRLDAAPPQVEEE